MAMRIGTEKGFAITELIVVVGIITILLGIAGIELTSLVRRYNVERQMRELYTDLSGAKARALMKNRQHCVTLTSTSLVIAEDLDPLPDGDGDCDDTDDTAVISKTLKFPIDWGWPTPKYFNSRGLATTMGTVCSNAGISADYDCVVIHRSRINLGKLTTPMHEGGLCSAANCVKK